MRIYVVCSQFPYDYGFNIEGAYLKVDYADKVAENFNQEMKKAGSLVEYWVEEVAFHA